MVDLPTGRVVYLVVKPVVGPEAENRFYVLPPQAVQLDSNGGSLELKASLAHFVAGPHFAQQYWTHVSDPDLAAKAYQHYAHPTGGTNAVEPPR